MRLLAALVVLVFASGCTSAAAPTPERVPVPPAATPVPPTATPVPPTPPTISASDPSIVAGGYEFVVVGGGFDTNVLGMQPAEFGAGDRILWVEFELLAGDRSSFEKLEILVSDGEDLESSPVALSSGGQILVMADLTETGADPAYRPDASSIAWAYVVPDAASSLQLVFSSGEVVDLSPILR